MQENYGDPSSRTEESSQPSDQDENRGQVRSRSESHFEPICRPKLDKDSRSTSQATSRSSRSLRRVYSLSDGYTHPAVDNDRLHEPEEDEKAEEVSAAPGMGYIVKWDGPADPANPRNMRLGRKWVIVLVLAVGSVCVTCTSSLYTMTYAQIMEEFHCSQIVATLGLSLFIFGLGVGPLVLAPLSEFYGRRIIYVASFTFFLIWLVPCAVAQNIETMLVARFFTGVSGSAFLSVAGGTVGDMFARDELAAPMMIYTASPFIGPELGPLRWAFYMLLIWAASVLIAIAMLVPETYHPVLFRRKAVKLRRETGDERWRAPIEMSDRSVGQTVLRSIYRPMMLLTMELMCLNLCIFSAILLGILYLFFGAFHLVFSTLHGFTLSQIGLSFIGLFVGMIFAIMSDPFWRKNYARLVQKRETKVGKLGQYEPEWRLPPAIAGAPLVSIGILIFAWTIYRDVHWIAPIIGSAVFGLGTILVYSGIFTFLVDAYPLYAASALAANSFLRSSFGAAFPLFGIQMYNRLGFNWASSLLAFLTVAMAPFP
ncbi:hypothetical protein ACJ73_06698 [Blastomyces percursus]|uniref:Major facilitator superfamily (MFS) profile domain-containing protein n=1 Tax=Blastomyces percursus TaxID=1658174 RepID=A0A1J9R0E8_9EURO|nr:hypothetical protein ACJ73_06698 [Blastomyces percursus]